MTLYGVEAHHQNGGAERETRKVVLKDNIFIIQAEIRLPEAPLDDIWLMAIDNYVLLQNTTSIYDL